MFSADDHTNYSTWVHNLSLACPIDHENEAQDLFVYRNIESMAVHRSILFRNPNHDVADRFH